jgi:hypothetical protein
MASSAMSFSLPLAELIVAENLIQHNFHMVARVPICVMVKAAILLQYAVQLDAARAHELDVSLR